MLFRSVKNIREKPKNDILKILSTYEVYNGKLDIIYDQLWDQITQEGVKNILGVLARLRREIDIQLIAKKTQQFKEIQELNDKFRHLFNIKGNYWSFYHNSFRLYLENKTAQFLSQYNEENDRSFHKQIVSFFEDSPDNFIEFIYHSYKADSLKNYLTDNSTSNFGLVFFRNLFFNFIHTDDIEEVFQLCFKALKDNFQFKAFLTVLFSNLELDNRSFEYDIEEDLSILFDTDNYNKAFKIIYDGRTLRLNPSSALHYAYELFKREQNEIAYDIYSQTEPLTLLRSKEAIDLDSRMNLGNSLKFYDYRMWLINWIKASYFVREIQEIIDIIRNLNLKSERNEVSIRSLQNEFLFNFGEIIFENCSEIEEFNILISCFDSSIDDDNDYLFWAKNRQAVLYQRLRDYKNENKILKEIIDYPKNVKLSRAQKIGRAHV